MKDFLRDLALTLTVCLILIVACSEVNAPTGGSEILSAKPGTVSQPKGNSAIVRYHLTPKHVDIVREADTAAGPGQVVTDTIVDAKFCLFFGFSDGRIGNRRGQTGCTETYLSYTTLEQRTLNKFQVAVMDTLKAASFRFTIVPIPLPASVRVDTVVTPAKAVFGNFKT